MNCSLCLGLEFETVLLSVSVSVWFMRPRSNKSRSQPRWQDQSVKSLGLVYKTHRESSLSLGLVFKYWSRHSVVLIINENKSSMVWSVNCIFPFINTLTIKIARRTTGAKERKSNKAIISFQKFDRSLNEIRNQC